MVNIKSMERASIKQKLRGVIEDVEFDYNEMCKIRRSLSFDDLAKAEIINPLYKVCELFMLVQGYLEMLLSTLDTNEDPTEEDDT